jgi:hypothetical protein
MEFPHDDAASEVLFVYDDAAAGKSFPSFPKNLLIELRDRLPSCPDVPPSREPLLHPPV